MYKDLWIYNININFNKEFPSTYRKVACIVSLLDGTQPIGMIRNISKRTCRICSNASLDGPVHILFECSSLTNVRVNMWGTVINSMPLGMANCVRMKTSMEKLDFGISGMKCETYVKEWCNIYHNIVDFIFSTYKERAKQYDELENIAN